MFLSEFGISIWHLAHFDLSFDQKTKMDQKIHTNAENAFSISRIIFRFRAPEGIQLVQPPIAANAECHKIQIAAGLANQQPPKNGQQTNI